MSLPQHISHQPATDRDLDPDIAEQEASAEPSDPRRRSGEQSLLESVPGLIGSPGVGGTEKSPVLVPERPQRGRELDGRGTDHHVIPGVPEEVRLCDHGGGDEGGDCGANAVEAVKEAEDFVGVGHVAYPGIPGCILEPVAKACEDEDDD